MITSLTLTSDPHSQHSGSLHSEGCHTCQVIVYTLKFLGPNEAYEMSHFSELLL